LYCRLQAFKETWDGDGICNLPAAAAAAAKAALSSDVLDMHVRNCHHHGIGKGSTVQDVPGSNCRRHDDATLTLHRYSTNGAVT
jgi:hypothetical protein